MKTLSLFSGAGGFDYGFEAGGFQIHTAVEANKDCVATLRLNMPHVHVHKMPIQEYDAGEPFDAIIAGPPCQGFSMAGKRDKADPRNQLISEVARVASEVQPQLIVVENVQGIETLKAGKLISFADRFERTLWSLDYKTTRWALDASFYGVPQLRKRTFLIGIRARNVPPPPPPDAHQTPAAVALTPPTPDAVLTRLDRLHMVAQPDRALDAPMATIDTASRWGWACDWQGAVFADKRWRLGTAACTPLTNAEYARLQTFPTHWNFVGKPSSVRRQIGNAVPPVMATRIATHLRVWMQQQKSQEADNLAAASL